jgi:hypothetical protein
MRTLLRLVLIAAGTAGLVVTFREETVTRAESPEFGVPVFRERTEIGWAFSPWYVRTTDTTRKPVVEEELKLLSWSVPLFGLSLVLIGLSLRLERRSAKSQPEEATW